jgi:trimeric autotransporter adhesin
MLEQLLASQTEKEGPVILNQAAYLKQNEPNPTNGTTRIQYFLPEGIQQATLLVTAINGQEIKRIGLPQTGEGQIELHIGTLPPGTYNYSLMMDGQVVDTKRMIIQK